MQWSGTSKDRGGGSLAPTALRPVADSQAAIVSGSDPTFPSRTTLRLRRPHRSTSPSSTHPDPHSAAWPPPSGCCSRGPPQPEGHRSAVTGAAVAPNSPIAYVWQITRRNQRNTRITQYTLILRSRAEVVRTKRGRPGGRAGRGVADIGRAGRLQAHRPGGKCRCTDGSGHRLRTNETAPRAPGCGRRPR